MKGLVGLIAINVVLSVALTLYRRKNEKLDVMTAVISAGITTIILNILAILEDIRATMWLLLSVPTAFLYGLLVSVPTNMLVQWYILRKRKEH